MPDDKEVVAQVKTTTELPGLRVPLGVFFVDSGRECVLHRAEISIEMGLDKSGSCRWRRELEANLAPRDMKEKPEPNRLDKALGLVKEFYLPGDWSVRPSLRVLALRQTREADPVLLGGCEGTIPMGGFLDYAWALRFDAHSGILARVFVWDAAVMARLLAAGGPIKKLLSMSIFASIPRDVAVELLVHEWSSQHTGAAAGE